MDKVTVEVNAPDVINLTSDAGDNITLSSTAVIVLPSSPVLVLIQPCQLARTQTTS